MLLPILPIPVPSDIDYVYYRYVLLKVSNDTGIELTFDTITPNHDVLTLDDIFWLYL